MSDQALDPGGRAQKSRGRAPGGAVRPAAGPAFRGRTRELKALREDIAQAGLDTLSGRKSSRARVLLIAGRPGSGRTALAEEFARQVADDYPDGVLRVRLTRPGGRPVPTASTARDLLTALGTPGAPGSGEEELTEALRKALAGRRFVLLLDDAGDPEQVHPLIPDEHDCLVLATSEGPLTGVPDVRPCALGGLDADAAVDVLAHHAGGRTRFTVDPVAARSLVEECAGQPAALVLAGGWLASRPKASVADLGRRLNAMPQGEEQAQGLRALARAFRLVYEELPPPAARMLRLLVLAPAGCVDAHIASALAGCSVTAAQGTLDLFAAQGLLRYAEGPGHGLPEYGVPGCLAPFLTALLQARDKPSEVLLARARMLERIVRQLQSCRATAEPVDSPARKRLAGLPKALRFPSPEAAAEWLDSRLPMLLAAAVLAVEDGELDTQARRLVSALVRALIAHRGEEAAAPELYPLHELVLGVAERRGLKVEQAAALLNLADLDTEAGRPRDALGRYRRALDAARSSGDPLLTVRALESLGGTYQELEDWQRAADWYGRALSVRLARNEPAEQARLYERLGAVHCYAGSWGEAMRNWRAAAAGHRRLRDDRGHARALGEMARVQEYAGRPEESLRTCEDALSGAMRAGDRRLQAALQMRMADTLDRLGDPAAARIRRGAADRLLSDTPGGACEIRSGLPKD
ncbi:tetratricopeptide repeat protein [Streptomyces sp. NPDC047108]|uniref:tetratricopeptide repeat protein n=1 Tax=Streptomyces sp. NPDC047108 TaxID=3155025 RepID=UPI0033CD6AFE